MSRDRSAATDGWLGMFVEVEGSEVLSEEECASDRVGHRDNWSRFLSGLVAAAKSHAPGL